MHVASCYSHLPVSPRRPFNARPTALSCPAMENKGGSDRGEPPKTTLIVVRRPARSSPIPSTEFAANVTSSGFTTPFREM
jgi:hypothetical protein